MEMQNENLSPRDRDLFHEPLVEDAESREEEDRRWKELKDMETSADAAAASADRTIGEIERIGAEDGKLTAEEAERLARTKEAKKKSKAGFAGVLGRAKNFFHRESVDSAAAAGLGLKKDMSGEPTPAGAADTEEEAEFFNKNASDNAEAHGFEAAALTKKIAGAEGQKRQMLEQLWNEFTVRNNESQTESEARHPLTSTEKKVYRTLLKKDLEKISGKTAERSGTLEEESNFSEDEYEQMKAGEIPWKMNAVWRAIRELNSERYEDPREKPANATPAANTSSRGGGEVLAAGAAIAGAGAVAEILAHKAEPTGDATKFDSVKNATNIEDKRKALEAQIPMIAEYARLADGGIDDPQDYLGKFMHTYESMDEDTQLNFLEQEYDRALYQKEKMAAKTEKIEYSPSETGGGTNEEELEQHFADKEKNEQMIKETIAKYPQGTINVKARRSDGTVDGGWYISAYLTNYGYDQVALHKYKKTNPDGSPDLTSPFILKRMTIEEFAEVQDKAITAKPNEPVSPPLKEPAKVAAQEPPAEKKPLLPGDLKEARRIIARFQLGIKPGEVTAGQYAIMKELDDEYHSKADNAGNIGKKIQITREYDAHLRAALGITEKKETNKEPEPTKTEEPEKKEITEQTRRDSALLGQAWNEFAAADQGIHKGDKEYLKQCVQQHLTGATVEITSHPESNDLAIVVISRPGQPPEALGIPLSDSFRNIMSYFEPTGSRNNSFSTITEIPGAAIFDAESLKTSTKPKLLEKGKAILGQ